MTTGQEVLPVCPVCTDRLGSYGGPVSLPCGHNGCLQCMASVQRRKPECPLCRAAFPAAVPLTVNVELRDLVALAATLHTVEEADGWQSLAAVKVKPQKGDEGYDPDATPGEGSEPAVALVPSAPPLHCDLETVLAGSGDLLSLEPPTWTPDSHAGDCMACHQAFRPFARGRHHCRLCGRIFCGACCRARLLLPPKFRQSEPARCCSTCAALLEPLQPFLAGTISRAVQPAVRDVTDASCGHSWLNPPLATGGLAGDIYKAANIATAFRKLGALQAERRIPAAVLRGAAGFAILSMAKVGLGWSCGVGSGLVVARREEDDSWSPPSALAALSAGWGLQVGGELTDLLVVLRSKAAVAAFCGTVAAGLGGAAAIAAGPLGRQADAGLTLGRSGAALCYSYSISRGAFVGVAVEGTVISTRDSANLAFYGRQHSARALLTGSVAPPPVAASALYQALDELLAWAEALPTAPGFLTNRSIKERDALAAARQQGCLLDGGLHSSGRRGARRSRRSRRASAGGAHNAVADPEGGWEAPEAEPSASFAEGDGWDTGSQLPGGGVGPGLPPDFAFGGGEGLAAFASASEGLATSGSGGFGGGRFRLARPPTRPEVSPPVTGRYFGSGAVQVLGGHVASDEGPSTPPQEFEDEDDAGFGGLFAE